MSGRDGCTGRSHSAGVGADSSPLPETDTLTASTPRIIFADPIVYCDHSEWMGPGDGLPYRKLCWAAGNYPARGGYYCATHVDQHLPMGGRCQTCGSYGDAGDPCSICADDSGARYVA